MVHIGAVPFYLAKQAGLRVHQQLKVIQIAQCCVGGFKPRSPGPMPAPTHDIAFDLWMQRSPVFPAEMRNGAVN